MYARRKGPRAMGKRILIVDDDESVRFVMRRALRSLGEGSEIVTAASGGEALHRFSEAPFDLVITDIRMPGMDGIRLTEAIRSGDARPAIVWVTAYGCEYVQSSAGRLGVSVCLEKPFQVSELRAAVATVIYPSGHVLDADRAIGENRNRPDAPASVPSSGQRAQPIANL